VLATTALATLLLVLRSHDVLASNEPCGPRETLAVLDERKDDVDRPKETVTLSFGSLLPLPDVRSTSTDDVNLFSAVLEVLRDDLPQSSPVLEELRDDVEKSSHDVKESRDDREQSRDDVEES
jgi:hypothetical protein